MTEQAPRSERGDTLVEVIVSVVILGIVTAGLLAGMTTTTASSNISRNQADAEAVLTSVSEAVRDPTAYPYQCPGDYTLGALPSLPTGWSASLVTITSDGQWNGSVFQPACADPAQMQKLTITVHSPDGQLTWTREIVKGPPA